MLLLRQFDWRLDHSGKVCVFCYEEVNLHKCSVCMNNVGQIFSKKFLEISRLVNVHNKLICKISDESKQKLPKNLLKLHFELKFVEKPGISSNFVGRHLHNLSTIL